MSDVRQATSVADPLPLRCSLVRAYFRGDSHAKRDPEADASSEAHVLNCEDCQRALAGTQAINEL